MFYTSETDFEAKAALYACKILEKWTVCKEISCEI